MKKQQLFMGFLLVGIGAFFLLRQLSIPFIDHIYSWPTLIMMIGLIYLFYSYLSKDYTYIFFGTILLGIGVHSYGLMHYSFWIENWTIYPLIIGMAFLIRFTKTRNGLIPGLCLVIIALAGAFSPEDYLFFYWLEEAVQLLETYWPLLLIFSGLFILYKNKQTGYKKVS